MIEVFNLKKVFTINKKNRKKLGKDKVIAVNEVSFIAKTGEIFGLLGPNGAGKTTTLRCISTLLKQTEGSVYVSGYDNLLQDREVRSSIGFLTNELKLDNHFTPDYTMEYFGELQGMTKEKINERKDVLFNYFGISDFRFKKISELSTGMKQKLSIAVSIIHDPEVIIFDEPTNGLDIITAKAVTDYLKELKFKGKTILISTHIMEVANKLCDEVAIIIDGTIKIAGNINNILLETNTENLEEAFFKLYYESVGDKNE